MAFEERYGGIWNLPLQQGESVLFERYLPDLDLVALVVNRVDGLLSVSVLRKVRDPQWRLPIWSTMEVPAVVETAADSEKYFEAATSHV